MAAAEPISIRNRFTISGRFNGFDGLDVIGWVTVPSHGDVACVVEVLVDGLVVATERADRTAETPADLQKLGRQCGFRVRLPEGILDGALHVVSVRDRGTGQELALSPRTMGSSLFVHKSSFAAASPSIDHPDGLTRILQRRLSGALTEAMADRLTKWHRDGYVIFEQLIDPRVVSKCNEDIDRAIAEAVHVLYQTPAVLTSLAEVPRPVDWNKARLLEFHSVSEAAAEIILNSEIVQFLAEILEGDVVAMQSLLFIEGSTQRAHMDFPYVHTPRPGFLAASWSALEDVREDAGPLFFFPGSHRLVPKYDFGGGNVMAFEDGAHIRDFENYVDAQSRRLGLPHRQFMAKAGDVLLWHSALVHGGSPRTNPASTRRSLVAHYSPAHVYCGDRKSPGKAPKIVHRNGGMHYDFQNPGDPSMVFPL